MGIMCNVKIVRLSKRMLTSTKSSNNLNLKILLQRNYH